MLQCSITWLCADRDHRRERRAGGCHRRGLNAAELTDNVVITDRSGLLARLEALAPEVGLINLENPSRDLLEEYFTVSRALARPIADQRLDGVEAVGQATLAGTNCGSCGPAIRSLLAQSGGMGLG